MACLFSELGMAAREAIGFVVDDDEDESCFVDPEFSLGLAPSLYHPGGTVGRDIVASMTVRGDTVSGGVKLSEGDLDVEYTRTAAAGGRAHACSVAAPLSQFFEGLALEADVEACDENGSNSASLRIAYTDPQKRWAADISADTERELTVAAVAAHGPLTAGLSWLFVVDKPRPMATAVAPAALRCAYTDDRLVATIFSEANGSELGTALRWSPQILNSITLSAGLGYKCTGGGGADDTLVLAFDQAKAIAEYSVDENTNLQLGLCVSSEAEGCGEGGASSLHYALSKSRLGGGTLCVQLLWSAPVAELPNWGRHRFGFQFFTDDGGDGD